jgi:hypothetical protein
MTAKSNEAPMGRPAFSATVFNQYGRPLGFGTGQTEQDAIREANLNADHELRAANPHWKWRKAKTKVSPSASHSQAG